MTVEKIELGDDYGDDIESSMGSLRAHAPETSPPMHVIAEDEDEEEEEKEVAAVASDVPPPPGLALTPCASPAPPDVEDSSVEYKSD